LIPTRTAMRDAFRFSPTVEAGNACPPANSRPDSRQAI
jgi:hypothetical protein